ncbi:MAG: sensor domain-containing diguanylate cyclase [Deltaproteobacteria bacterium]|nr:sensor domain-containing diguanylate cyclase [Deltaproteobacteria bacterium]
MTDLTSIIDILRHNEKIARRFFEIEKRILSVLNFTDLFEVLLAEIRQQFKVPYAWMTLIEKSEIFNFIQQLESSDRLKARLNLVDRETFGKLVGTQMKPLLVNQDLKPYYRLLPQSRPYVVQSMAIAPISLDGEIIGSLNQADMSCRRFQPGMDVSLLEQLAVKVSLCLSNVTAHEKLRFLAYHDPLTGLLNRRVMASVLSREFARSRRYPQFLSLVFLDLDHFKNVNDRCGHDRGDELLVYVAKGLTQLSRATDVVARYAGDEFVIILPETTKASAAQLMRRICAHFSEYPLDLKDMRIPVSISFGIASAEDEGVLDPESLLKKADNALYEAKQSRPSLPGPLQNTLPQTQKIIELPPQNTEGAQDHEHGHFDP